MSQMTNADVLDLCREVDPELTALPPGTPMSPEHCVLAQALGTRILFYTDAVIGRWPRDAVSLSARKFVAFVFDDSTARNRFYSAAYEWAVPALDSTGIVPVFRLSDTVYLPSQHPLVEWMDRFDRGEIESLKA